MASDKPPTFEDESQHLPGLDNVIADYLSRYLTDRTDWMLDPSIFQCLETIWGPLQVDLFPTRFTRQLHHFYSWRPDPEAEATDALVQSWSNIKGYAHPPWCLISRVLLKIWSDKATIVLITPLWHTQAQFPALLELHLPNPATSGTTNNCSLPQLCGSSIGDGTPTGRLEGLRQRLRGRKPIQITIQHGSLGKPGV